MYLQGHDACRSEGLRVQCVLRTLLQSSCKNAYVNMLYSYVIPDPAHNRHAGQLMGKDGGFCSIDDTL